MVAAFIATATFGGSHRTPTGWLLVVVIVLVLLYVGMRTGILMRAWNALGAWRGRGGLHGLRVSPMALVPTVLLVIVIVVLLLGHH